jgi:predicted phage terminase large subunit-like protein
LEIPGEALVLDTRKYLDDFAGNIAKPPLNNLFFTLHRRVRWPTTEADNPPYVVDGYRYYYPVKGDGKPALNKAEVDRLESQMVERKFSAEYLNDPLDPSKVLFKREHFKVITREQAPPEVKYGLGRGVSEDEQGELDALKVRIVAYNSCDPASKDEQSKKGDDTFIVCIRLDRWGALYVTRLQAGKWTASRTWKEIEIANSYNRPYITDYELPSDEKHVRPSFEKYLRERQEETGQAPTIPMRWEHMPKSGKMGRIEQMETWTKNGNFYVLADAAEQTLIDKYINQWVALGVADHDDGPDATARLLSHLRMHTYQAPPKRDEEPLIKVSDAGEASVPVTLIKEMAINQKVDGLWGETGW